MPMQRRLPPLTSLRAFEAAGRHLSFTKAAEELTVTQAAISHQVKALEEHLDTALFLRLPRQLELTKAGKILLPVVRDAFTRIGESVAKLNKDVASSVLTVKLAPSFAAKWLSPRLDDFRRKHPQIELSLTHSNDAADFRRQPIDIAITYGKGNWRGVVADRVLSIDFFPVCCPQFMQGEYPLTTPENLAHYTLLHDTDHVPWSDWLALAGIGNVDPQRGTMVDDTNVLIQAAMDGLGVALGSAHFVDDRLASGRLVRPFDTTLSNDYAYYVVCPKMHLKRSEVAVFKAWLMEQSSEDN
jgi:LysR family glycine cleavage system transcriptional activator